MPVDGSVLLSISDDFGLEIYAEKKISSGLDGDELALEEAVAYDSVKAEVVSK